jgi:hypothetical protein
MTAAATIQMLAARLGEDDLVALANRGTVRRARKDLESGPSPVPASTPMDGAMVYQYDGQTIHLRNPIAQSSCDCPAGGGGGCCRHVLVCILHAAQLPAAACEPSTTTADTPSCSDEMLAMSDEQLQAWAGRAVAARATRELANGLSLQTSESADVLVAKITEWSIECRWLRGGGLDGFLCSCRDASPCVHRVAAVMALQRDRGVRTIEHAATMLEDSGQTPRSRDELRVAIGHICIQIIEQGFSRLSRFHATQLRVLSVAAHGADLPRLERVARATADQIDGWLARSATASDELLLSSIAQTHALACALATPTPALVGEHRRRYERTPPLDLVGAGAQTWRTPSGFRGLTVYFWDAAASTWCSWTESRPIDQHFDPGARAGGDGPWMSCASPRHAATHRGRLADAWRSRAMRLSGRPSTKYNTLQPTTASDLPAPIVRWSDLAACARNAFSIGLSQGTELAGLVLLSPERWLTASFDALHQVLVRPIVAVDGARLRLVVPHEPETAALSHAIEHLKPRKRAMVLAKLVMDHQGLAAAPISVIDDQGVGCIGVQPAANRGSLASAPLEEADDEAASPSQMPTTFAGSSPLVAVLDQAGDVLTAAAAIGSTAYRRWDRFSSTASSVESHGYQTLGAALSKAQSIAAPDRKAAALLAASWIHACTRQATIVELGSVLPRETPAI